MVGFRWVQFYYVRIVIIVIDFVVNKKFFKKKPYNRTSYLILIFYDNKINNYRSCTMSRQEDPDLKVVAKKGNNFFFCVIGTNQTFDLTKC